MDVVEKPLPQPPQTEEAGVPPLPEHAVTSEFIGHFPNLPDATTGDEDEGGQAPKRKAGRRKIPIEFIEDKSRRQITFSKRKAGLMKKAYELTTLTGTQALLLVASETGHVYTFATPKLQPFVTIPEGKSLIQACLNAPDPQPQPQTQMPGVQTRTPAPYEEVKPRTAEEYNQMQQMQQQQQQQQQQHQQQQQQQHQHHQQPQQQPPPQQPQQPQQQPQQQPHWPA